LRKALATFGSGPARACLDLALPNFEHYAVRHGYDLIVGDGESNGRPPSWGKVPLLRRLLDAYDLALWIDSDALILDSSVDIAGLFAEHHFQAYAVLEAWPDLGLTPCLGVWALRACQRAGDFLDAVWEQEDLIDHEWWEQAAAMRLIGWTFDRPMFKRDASSWDDGTLVLGEDWDQIPSFPIGYQPCKIRHYAGWPYRRRVFDMRTDLAALSGRHPRRQFGLLERRLRPIYSPLKGRMRRLLTV
jgi:hypothetical protein